MTKQLRFTSESLSPLYKMSIGFDRLADQFFNDPSFATAQTGYPPFNITKQMVEGQEEPLYAITLAVAGFTKKDIDISIEDGTLKVEGKTNIIDTDESIEFLRSAQDKAIIVASNSPYRKLINQGIKPHLVVTADPLSPTLAGFENVSLEGVPLACPFSAYPEIVKRFSGRILSWCTFNPIVDVLREQRGEKLGTKILEKGTVSACILDLARLFGCKKVLLIGQDMSVRDDGRYYSEDTSYSDTGAHYSNSSNGQRLPGNTQENVLVEGRLFVYLKTFEQFIDQTLSPHGASALPSYAPSG